HNLIHVYHTPTCTTSPLSHSHSPPPHPIHLFFLRIRPPPISTLFPYTTLFRSVLGFSERSSPAALDLLCELAFAHCGERELAQRSEEHTSELQSRGHLVCRLLLEKKKK